MNTPSQTPITSLNDFATTTMAWRTDADQTTYYLSPEFTTNDSVESAVQTLTHAQLLDMDSRLPVLVEYAFKTQKLDSERGKLISRSVRRWIDQKPMPLLTAFLDGAFLDEVKEIISINDEAREIRIRTVACQFKKVNTVEVVSKAHSIGVTLPFSEVEKYFPNFLVRIDLAQGMGLDTPALLQYTFPMTPEKNAMASNYQPKIPSFGQ